MNSAASATFLLYCVCQVSLLCVSMYCSVRVCVVWCLCDFCSKYLVLQSIRDLEDTRTQTHTDSGQVSGGGFKSLAQRVGGEWVWRRGSVNDDVIWEKQRKEENSRGRHIALIRYCGTFLITFYIKLQMTSLFTLLLSLIKL